MDPLSISTAVLALTRTVLISAKELHSLRERFSSASRLIVSITTESNVIGAFLVQLESLLKRSPEAIAARIQISPELGDVLQTALNDCADIFQQLTTEISYFKENPKKPGQLKFRAKVRYLWNEEHLKELLYTLRGQHAAFASLLQCFSTLVKASIHVITMLRYHRADIIEIKHGLQQLRESLDVRENHFSGNITIPDEPALLADEKPEVQPQLEDPLRPPPQTSMGQMESTSPALDVSNEKTADSLLKDTSSLKDFDTERPEPLYDPMTVPPEAPPSPPLYAREDQVAGSKGFQRSNAVITFLLEDAFTVAPSQSSGTATVQPPRPSFRNRPRKQGSSKPLILSPDVVSSLLH